MKLFNPNIITAAILLVLLGAASCWSQEPVDTPMINTRATETLKRMADFLGKVKQFKVTTENTLEYLLDSGHRVDIDISSEVFVSRPNKLRAERHGKIVDQFFYYNGKELSLYDPGTNFYATESVPDNYLELFRYMASTFGFAVPVSDLILEDAYSLLIEEVTLAAYLGRSSINGVLCDQLIFSRPGVDFQVWVAVGDKPFPCKYVVTDTSGSDRLSIRTTMHGWNFNPEIKDASFTFTPAEESQKIGFLLF